MTAPAAPSPTVAPASKDNAVDAGARRSNHQIALDVIARHRSGLIARREHDLLSEKLLLHVDGTGDFQWADINDGQKAEIPRFVSEYRRTENLLRPIVDNAVAHHTTMPLRFMDQTPPDRRSRDRGLVNSLWMNYLSDEQDLNGKSADALYLAMPAGFCPLHRYWCDDDLDGYESMTDGRPGQVGGLDVPPGRIDIWVGNPFDTVFGAGSKRGSVHWASYGRLMHADMVRARFYNVPGVAALQGTRRIPSADEFQRIARSWSSSGLGVHGSAVIQPGRGEYGDEMLYVLCREVLPGVESQWKRGRLQIVIVPGLVDLRRGEGGGDGVLVYDGPLPAADFSWTLFYSHHRGMDVLSKPWVEDLDQLQVELNIAISKRWEAVNRQLDAPIVVPGGAVEQEMAEFGPYNMLEVDPSYAAWRPAVLQWPEGLFPVLDNEINDKRRAMYTIGGYQASSRGESSGSRMPYRAIVALQQADNTIHGPVNQRFQRSICDFGLGCWRQMKEYGSVGWIIRAVGSEYEDLVDPYVDSERLSAVPPSFKLVNAFGASPELRAQEVIELATTVTADKKPFLTTEEARRAYPNYGIFGADAFPGAVQRRRARAVANAIVHAAARFDALVQDGTPIVHPWIKEAARRVYAEIEASYPRLRDDDLMAHIASLSELTQDETAGAVARVAAMMRQSQYYAWQAQMAAQGQPGQAQLPAGQPHRALPPGSAPSPAEVAAEMQGAGGGTGAAPLESEASGPSPIAATARG